MENADGWSWFTDPTKVTAWATVGLLIVTGIYALLTRQLVRVNNTIVQAQFKPRLSLVQAGPRHSIYLLNLSFGSVFVVSGIQPHGAKVKFAPDENNIQVSYESILLKPGEQIKVFYPVEHGISTSYLDLTFLHGPTGSKKYRVRLELIESDSPS
jgi:hypothetical protein